MSNDIFPTNIFESNHREQPIVRRDKFFRKDQSVYEVRLVKPPASTVWLVSWSNNQEELLSRILDVYRGKMDRIPSIEQIDADFDDVNKTKFKDALAMMHYTFFLDGVGRGFTHQMVRYAIGTRFAQESMRFYGTHDVYKVIATGKAISSERYWQAICYSINCYDSMINEEGMETEDARGALPTNVLTKMYVDLNVLSLQNVVTTRLCCQAQKGEWVHVILQMRQLIRDHVSAKVANLLKAPVELGKSCGYDASFDKPCRWKNGIPEELDDHNSV